MKKEIQYPTREWLDDQIDKYLNDHPDERIDDFTPLEEMAEQLWWDKQIDKGNPTPFDPAPEVLKDLKVGAKAEKPKGERKPRERKPDEDKRHMIDLLRVLMEGLALNGEVTGVQVLNPEREVSFNLNGTDYSFTLIKHRPGKTTE